MTKPVILTTALAILLLAHLPSSVYTRVSVNDGDGGVHSSVYTQVYVNDGDGDVPPRPEPDCEETNGTTESPTQAQAVITAEVPIVAASLSSLCDDCEFLHGIGYNSHPTDCTLFIQCSLASDGETYDAAVLSCPHGQYWNQDALTCDLPKNVKCSDDICQGSPKTKISRASCRGYWNCSSGNNIANCCPKGAVYDPSTDLCVDQPKCQDDCLDSTPNPEPTECSNSMKGISGEPYYSQKVHLGWLRRSCAPGTVFATETCGCHTIVSAATKECLPEVDLPFSKDDQDVNGRVAVLNQGVTVKNGRAFFYGNGSRLIINRFSNTFWGSTIYIRIVYKIKRRKGLGYRPTLALFSNGDCDRNYTLSACAGPKGVNFYAKTEDSGPVSMTVGYDPYLTNMHWRKRVKFQLNKGHLRGVVNYRSKKMEAQGNLVTSKCGLVIGSGGGCEDFYGYITSVKIYLCKPKRGNTNDEEEEEEDVIANS